MKKLFLLICVGLLFCFNAAYGQTIETLDPTNIGDYFSWDDQMIFTMAGLANIGLSDSNFTWGPASDESLGLAYVGTYTDENGSRLYTFQFNPDTKMLQEVVYTGIFNENDKLSATMRSIIETYGLAQAKPYENKYLETKYSSLNDYLDEWNIAASDSTICVYGYSSVKQGNVGMILLDFLDRKIIEQVTG